MIRGKQNASVLPDPVKAMPMTSRPENLNNLLCASRPDSEENSRDGDALQLNGCGLHDAL